METVGQGYSEARRLMALGVGELPGQYPPSYRNTITYDILRACDEVTPRYWVTPLHMRKLYISPMAFGIQAGHVWGCVQ